MLSHTEIQNVDLAICECVHKIRSGSGHTDLEQQLTEHTQKAFGRPFKNVVKKEEREKS